MKVLKIALIAVLLLPAFACKKTTANLITGSWKQLNGGDSIKFSPDGTFTATMAYGMGGQPKAFSGTYFVNDQAVSVTDKDDPQPADDLGCEDSGEPDGCDVLSRVVPSKKMARWLNSSAFDGIGCHTSSQDILG